MAKRLSIKHRKQKRDKLTAYKAGDTPKRHKIAEERSVKHRFKNNSRAK